MMVINSCQHIAHGRVGVTAGRYFCLFSFDSDKIPKTSLDVVTKINDATGIMGGRELTGGCWLVGLKKVKFRASIFTTTSITFINVNGYGTRQVGKWMEKITEKNGNVRILKGRS